MGRGETDTNGPHDSLAQQVMRCREKIDDELFLIVDVLGWGKIMRRQVNCNMESHVRRGGMGVKGPEGKGKRGQYHFSWHKIDNAPSFLVVTDQATLPQGPEPIVLLHQIIRHQRDRPSANASHLRLTTNSACMTLFLHHAPTMGWMLGGR
jgi:hypothetical protein